MEPKTTEEIIRVLKHSHKPLIDLSEVLYTQADMLTRRELIILARELTYTLRRMTIDNDSTPLAIQWLAQDLEDGGFLAR
jgi:hypothetical protein